MSIGFETSPVREVFVEALIQRAIAEVTLEPGTIRGPVAEVVVEGVTQRSPVKEVFVEPISVDELVKMIRNPLAVTPVDATAVTTADGGSGVYGESVVFVPPSAQPVLEDIWSAGTLGGTVEVYEAIGKGTTPEPDTTWNLVPQPGANRVDVEISSQGQPFGDITGPTMGIMNNGTLIGTIG